MHGRLPTCPAYQPEKFIWNSETALVGLAESGTKKRDALVILIGRGAYMDRASYYLLSWRFWLD